MKKLILIIVSIVAVAGIAYGTATAMSTLMPDTPKTTSINTETMPHNEPDITVDTPAEPVVDMAADTEIKNNLSQIATALTNYAANNRGKYPTTGDETIAFENNYLTNVSVDPVTKKKYSISAAAGSDFTKVTYQVGYVCSDDDSLVVASSNRSFAIQLPLTSGKNYCVDNQ